MILQSNTSTRKNPFLVVRPEQSFENELFDKQRRFGILYDWSGFFNHKQTLAWQQQLKNFQLFFFSWGSKQNCNEKVLLWNPILKSCWKALPNLIQTFPSIYLGQLDHMRRKTVRKFAKKICSQSVRMRIMFIRPPETEPWSKRCIFEIILSICYPWKFDWGVFFMEAIKFRHKVILIDIINVQFSNEENHCLCLVTKQCSLPKKLNGF